MDWVSRDDNSLLGELAELHDFDDGTFPWFEGQMSGLGQRPEQSIIMLSHHPMMMLPGAFNLIDAAQISAVTQPLEHLVYASFAGHFHGETQETWEEGGYEVVLVDATWDDDVTVKVVEVWGNDATFDYVQETVIVEWE